MKSTSVKHYNDENPEPTNGSDAIQQLLEDIHELALFADHANIR
jgi:hypothetical protein